MLRSVLRIEKCLGSDSLRLFSSRIIGSGDIPFGKKYSKIIGSDEEAKDGGGVRGRTPASDQLLRELCARIRFSGPITLAEYMKEVLTNPKQGVYMNVDALGADGHFITSPEISQMFGECVGVWLLNEWLKMGGPSPLQIVELGPGKGTLIDDVLRTVQQLRPDLLEKASLHLVEVSPEMRKLQKQLLCGNKTDFIPDEKTISKFGTEVHWHDSLRSVPKQFSFFIAHEFFDALPIHKFVKTKEGWREVLVDIDVNAKENKLRYVLSKNETPSCALIDPFEKNSQLEMSPQSGILIKQLSERIVEFGGIGLVADYGGLKQTDSFRAFAKHKQVHPLTNPGGADLTADVDFNYLSSQVSKDCSWFGPISQSVFLHSSGIVTRCQQLIKGGGSEKTILEAYQTLTHPDKMGERFKFVSLFPGTMEPIHNIDPPVGFAHQPIQPDLAKPVESKQTQDDKQD